MVSMVRASFVFGWMGSVGAAVLQGLCRAELAQQGQE